ncbi:hypothetical protein QWZ13_14270 [Reinekea marina]|uniref:hypothetical protein n=1 Tax=Reinekea marina TaxID=1310421 RepID=UPI0025B416DE|nr:hypothetical protein [Reinekea marina]MDN3650081.1 hypothetical protein [Reinekea marina]
MLVGIPLVALIFGFAAGYIYWISIEPVSWPIQVYLVIYLASGIGGYFLRKFWVAKYVSKIT